MWYIVNRVPIWVYTVGSESTLLAWNSGISLKSWTRNPLKDKRTIPVSKDRRVFSIVKQLRHEKTCFISYANNKDTDQPIVVIFGIPRLLLASVTKQAGSSLTWSQSPENRYSHDVAQIIIPVPSHDFRCYSRWWDNKLGMSMYTAGSCWTLWCWIQNCFLSLRRHEKRRTIKTKW